MEVFSPALADEVLDGIGSDDGAHGVHDKDDLDGGGVEPSSEEGTGELGGGTSLVGEEAHGTLREVEEEAGGGVVEETHLFLEDLADVVPIGCL